MVASPKPYSIVETPVIRQLIADGVVVIAAGGGGVPVIEKGPRLIGKEGVVDKDLAAAILAREVEAEVLLILTDVPRVQRGFGSLMPEDIERMDVAEARRLLKRGEFGGGSMGPKVEAAMHFVEQGGRRAVIADLAQATEALAGAAGTELVAEADYRRSERPGLRNCCPTTYSANRPTSAVSSASPPRKMLSRMPKCSGSRRASMPDMLPPRRPCLPGGAPVCG